MHSPRLKELYTKKAKIAVYKFENILKFCSVLKNTDFLKIYNENR